MAAQPARKQHAPLNITEEEAYSLEHTLAKNIKMYRELFGLTQEDLARAIGASLSTVSKWESAVMVPRPEWLASLAKLFDIPVGYLFGVDEPYPKGKKKRKKRG
jgi:transcriptional regulator with XRE-family HTH domain